LRPQPHGNAAFDSKFLSERQYQHRTRVQSHLDIDAEHGFTLATCWYASKRRPVALCMLTPRSLLDDYVRLLLRAERKWHALAVDMHNSPASGSLSEAVSVLLDLKKTGAQALRIGKHDVTPPEPMRLSDQGPFGGATPNWPRTGGGTMPSYGEVQNWFDTLDLFASPAGFGGPV